MLRSGTPRQPEPCKKVKLRTRFQYTGELRVGLNQIIEDSSNVRVPDAQGVPGDMIVTMDDKQPILAIHEWRKAGSEVGGGPAVSCDPATGKHFYTLNGVKVFTD